MANQWGLTRGEHSLFRSLNTPHKIQDYIESKLIYNFDTEPNGDPTCYSPRVVLETNKAHCFEGSMFAAAARMINGFPGQLIDFSADQDDDHVLAIHWRSHNGRRYRGTVGMGGYHLIMYRDPIYATPRELALSFVEGYHPLRTDTRKSLRKYSAIVNLDRFDPTWITSCEPIHYIGEALNRARHYRLFPASFDQSLRAVHPDIAQANARFKGK
jgi:hypothetical protein